MDIRQLIRDYFAEFLKHYKPSGLVLLTGLGYNEIHNAAKGTRRISEKTIEQLKNTPAVLFEQWGKGGFDAKTWVNRMRQEHRKSLEIYRIDKTAVKAQTKAQAKAHRARLAQERAARLQAVREQTVAFAERFSQYQICEITGINKTSILRFTRGKAELSDQNLQKIEQSIVMQPEKWDALQKQEKQNAERKVNRADSPLIRSQGKQSQIAARMAKEKELKRLDAEFKARYPKPKPVKTLYTGIKIVLEHKKWTVYRLGRTQGKPFCKAVFSHPNLEDAQAFADELTLSTAIPHKSYVRQTDGKRSTTL